MDNYKGRVALVTGASSGIGRAVCEILVKHGMKVIGIARRMHKLKALEESLSECEGTFVPYQCDATVDQQVHSVFDYIKETYDGIDVCVNNAGLSNHTTLLDGDTEEWRKVIEINVIALSLIAKLAVKSMEGKGIKDGYIINVGSAASHTVCKINSLHFYTCSKFAVKALTEGLRQELQEKKSGIRVTLLSPGAVDTEMLRNFEANADKEKMLSKSATLTSEDMAALVLHMLSTPLRVEVTDVIVHPIPRTY